MKRYIANITIEAQTPLKVGSKTIDFLQDSPVQRDWNDLPMILGTSLAGVLRKEFKKDKANSLFGDENANKKDNEGSKVIISNALLCDEDGKVHEELLLKKTDFLQNFSSLPLRDHTAITSKGVALEHSKFDEEVVYKGARFKFNLELLALDGVNEEDFKSILSLLYKNSFRVGGGSTKGFGKIKVVKITYDEYDEDSEEYENFKNSLNAKFSNSHKLDIVQDEKYITYEVSLTPDDFYMFGGWYDMDADNSQVYEKIVIYEDNSKAKMSERKILIPASSIKGALSHRTVYYYNALNKKYIGCEDYYSNVENIFGAKKDDNKTGSKGKVIFSDMFLEDDGQTKIFDHVSIDRFTGGAIEGALFQEKTISSKQELKFEILLEKNEIKKEALEAFEKALDDLVSGMLPLGGATTKGHGVFTGKWSEK